MEQAPSESRGEQFLRQSIELWREEPCCRVRDVKVRARLVGAQSQDDDSTDVIAPILGRGGQ